MGVKKRKLGSKNPKYMVKVNDNSPVVKEKKLMCNAPVRNVNGELVEGTTIPVYGVWYENDEVKNK
jgi:hypothetical protein|tara:strand:+ start:1450 stop:1647 length:198 start_codon:yes stop_codon:yes gene_type:complete